MVDKPKNTCIIGITTEQEKALMRRVGVGCFHREPRLVRRGKAEVAEDGL